MGDAGREFRLRWGWDALLLSRCSAAGCGGGAQSGRESGGWVGGVGGVGYNRQRADCRHPGLSGRGRADFKRICGKSAGGGQPGHYLRGRVVECERKSAVQSDHPGGQPGWQRGRGHLSQRLLLSATLSPCQCDFLAEQRRAIYDRRPRRCADRWRALGGGVPDRGHVQRRTADGQSPVDA